ncbi:hypothetical protein MHU86_12017 [Fragilaria crotonensis]|nr:hypothetical protein MHU86_12017 [Fragilaria crotonensis]
MGTGKGINEKNTNAGEERPSQFHESCDSMSLSCNSVDQRKSKKICARAYICTYYYLEQENRGNNVGENLHEFNPVRNQQLLFKKIEQLMKRFKTHRCALDFDMRFVLAALKADDEDDGT